MILNLEYQNNKFIFLNNTKISKKNDICNSLTHFLTIPNSIFNKF